PRRVHAIDTFVSADSPLELPNFAVAPIGAGAVARALDNTSVTPPAYADSPVRLARPRGVALQAGTTNGGNDGPTFTPSGAAGPERSGHGLTRDEGGPREDAPSQRARRPAGPARPRRRPRRAGEARDDPERARGRQPLCVSRDGGEARRRLRSGGRADRHG